MKIGEKTIIVTDEMGTVKINNLILNCLFLKIRIYNYPCEENGVGYMRCYADHLNKINNAVLSYDRNYLATSSIMDRCIMIWRVRKTEEENDDEDEDDERENLEIEKEEEKAINNE